MNFPLEYNFPRYLAAKKSVDDRALNRHLWNALMGELQATSQGKTLRVLEIGAGIGTMIERVLDWGLLGWAHYTALDSLPDNIRAILPRLSKWAAEQGFNFSQSSPSHSLLGPINGKNFEIEVVEDDIFNFISRHSGAQYWDLLIAHAFLDLMDIPTTLSRFRSLLRPGSLFYFTLAFDGVTLLEPIIEPQLDELIQTLYHRNMDERLTGGKLSGDSQAGRHLFAHLAQAGYEILDAGASDWVVFPLNGNYPQDEAYFLHFIIHTIHQALLDHPQLNASDFETWVTKRHLQIDRAELVYIAHQLDFVGKITEA